MRQRELKTKTMILEWNGLMLRSIDKLIADGRGLIGLLLLRSIDNRSQTKEDFKDFCCYAALIIDRRLRMT